MLRRLLLAIVALATASATMLLALQPASAAPSGWASFAPLTGSTRDFETTMQQKPAGFPAAAVTSDSTTGAAVGVQTGASTFLGPLTEVGAKYGSSQGQPYLNLRPTRANGNPASTTTYAFERPTPTRGWTFVLGDIDADQVTISATDADDTPVDPVDLGFRGTFNYCATGLTPKPTTCSGQDNDGTSLPTWDEEDGLLRGNAGALDTAGAAAWFEPTIALSSLTFTYAQRSGAPVYQTWFSALQFDIAGTVSVDGGSPEGQTVRLYDPEGNRVGETKTASDGTYSFPGRATYKDYRIELVRPDGFTSDNALSQRVDLSEGDRTDVNFRLREIVPVPVSGKVTVVAGEAVPGVTLTLADAGGLTVGTAITDDDGNYLFDTVAVGDGYTITITTPEDFTSDPATYSFNVPANSTTPIGGQDFVLTPVPAGSVAGTVTDGDGPRSGVVVTLTGPDGFDRVVRTADDGTYSLDGLPPGDYTATVTAPSGTTVSGSPTQNTTITVAGEARTGIDFALTVIPAPPTYEAGGTVTSGGDPVAGVEITLTFPGGGTMTAETDAEGVYAFPDLDLSSGYTVTVTPPDGYTVTGAPTKPFTVVDSDVSGLDFVLAPQVDVVATVTDGDGRPVPDATVVLSGDDADLPLVTDDSGTVTFSDVPPGDYTATIQPPDGYSVPEGDTTQDVTIGDEDVQLAFVLEAEAASPSPSSPPSASASASPEPSASASEPAASPEPGSSTSATPTGAPTADASTGGAAPVSDGGGDLADTGGPSRVILLVGLGLLVIGGGATVVGRLRTRRRAGAHQG